MTGLLGLLFGIPSFNVFDSSGGVTASMLPTTTSVGSVIRPSDAVISVAPSDVTAARATNSGVWMISCRAHSSSACGAPGLKESSESF